MKQGGKEDQIGVWKISIGGYGSFEYVGTSFEAEDMRSHKAQWERGVGRREWLRDADGAEVKEWDQTGPYALDSEIARQPPTGRVRSCKGV